MKRNRGKYTQKKLQSQNQYIGQFWRFLGVFGGIFIQMIFLKKGIFWTDISQRGGNKDIHSPRRARRILRKDEG